MPIRALTWLTLVAALVSAVLLAVEDAALPDLVSLGADVGSALVR